MARLAPACAAAIVALVIAMPGIAAGNTITTVAGGGSTTPLDYTAQTFVDPLALNIPGPTGIAWSGAASGMFYVVTPSKCVQLWNEPNQSSNSYGMEIEGGVWEGCNPLSGGYAAGTDANVAKLNNPCCVASNLQWDETEADTSVGPLVASTDSGHVNLYRWANNKAETVAGSTPPSSPDCSNGALMPEDGVAPTSAHFCKITALARRIMSSNYAIGERDRGPNPGVLYFVDSTVHKITVSGNGSPIPTAFAALAYDRGNNLYISDGKSALYIFTAGSALGLYAGLPNLDPAFSGDGGSAPNARFANPKGLGVGFDNSVYIADTDNCRIRRITEFTGNANNTTVSTVAGNGCDAGAALGDGGEATAANLDHPVGVAMASTGLLITDTGHNLVRLVDRTSIVHPPAFTADNTPTFDIRSLDDDVATDCAGIGPLSDGPHTLKAWENGNAATPPDPPDPTPATATFTVDTAAPTGVDLVSPGPNAGVPVDTDFVWSTGGDASGIDHYELWIDGAKNRDVPASACGAGGCSAKAAQPLAEGGHTWQIRAVDLVGNTAATGTRALSAGGPPTAAFTISPNPSLTGRTVVFDASTSSDESGIARYEWDLDGDGIFEADSGGPTTSRSYPAPATITIGLRVTDGVGKTSTTTRSLKVNSPTGGQNLIGVTINQGAQFTRDPNVVLTVKPPPNTSAFIISNDGGFLAPTTFPAASTIKWKLDSSGPERLPKIVYLRFVFGPIISDNFTDDIILDQIPPVVQQASLVPLSPPTRAANAAKAKAKSYTVKVKAKDSNSGVGKVQVTANKRKPGKLLVYRSKVNLKSAARPKFVRARDKAGNFSSWKKLR